MTILTSELDSNSEQFRNNRQAMLAALEEFRAVEEKVRAKEQAAQEKFHKRGKLLPRERLSLLLDAGSEFIDKVSKFKSEMSFEVRNGSFDCF